MKRIVLLGLLGISFNLFASDYSWTSSSSSSNYQGDSGRTYQYDNSKYEDRIRSQYDYNAQQRDRQNDDYGFNNDRQDDQNNGQYGTGIYND